MIIIDQTTQSIALTRGDYAAFVFRAFEDDGVTLYDLNEGDKVVLQIGKKYGSPILVKENPKENSLTTTVDDYTIEVLPDDTKEMKFDDYVYDVSIVTSAGNVYTYIGATEDNEPKFTILKEVGGSDDD